MILDLSLKRFCQVVTAIQVRQYQEQELLMSLWSWHARTLATNIALTVPLPEGKKEHKLFEQARRVGITQAIRDDIEASIEEQEAVDSSWTPDQPSPVLAQVHASHNLGGFERLMGGFKGSPE